MTRIVPERREKAIDHPLGRPGPAGATHGVPSYPATDRLIGIGAGSVAEYNEGAKADQDQDQLVDADGELPKPGAEALEHLAA